VPDDIGQRDDSEEVDTVDDRHFLDHRVGHQAGDLLDWGSGVVVTTRPLRLIATILGLSGIDRMTACDRPVTGDNNHYEAVSRVTSVGIV
jgi:hypothetical protein